MTRWKRMSLILCLCAVALPAAAGTKKPNNDGVIAIVEGQAIRQADIEERVGNRLIKVRTEEYNVRRGALEEEITKRLIAAEAKRRNVTVEELLRAEVDAKIVVPTAAEVEPFYEGTKDRYASLAKEEAINSIIDGMTRQKSLERMTELVRQLRAGSKVQVMLEPPRAVVPSEGPSRGAADAAVTIVEFSDYECPYCGRAATTLKKISDNYGDRVRIVFRDYPLPIHRGAPRAAEAAHCAGDQGKYWEMHDRLFSKGGAISDGDIRKFAAEIQLDGEAFSQCLGSGKHTETWKAAQKEGSAAGVQSTPTFFVNGRLLNGAAPYEQFVKVIDEELERAASLKSGPRSSGSPASGRK